MIAKKQKTELALQINPHCHMRAKYRKPFLDWYAKIEKQKKRRPTATELVKEMRRKGSQLRGLIEQDSVKAAAKHWEQRAKYYLAHVEVVRVNVTTREVLTDPVRAYVPLRQLKHRPFGSGSYVPTGRITNKEDRFSVVEQAYADLAAWVNRFERYAEFLDVFGDVVRAYRNVEKRMKDRLK